MTKLFVLVIILWGFNGNEWVYVGNQIAFKEPVEKEVCLVMADNWSKHEMNQYFRFSIECIEQFGKSNI